LYLIDDSENKVGVLDLAVEILNFVSCVVLKLPFNYNHKKIREKFSEFNSYYFKKLLIVTIFK
jgi:hypothetical protein